MKSESILCCVVALLLGMLLANMFQNVCGCKNIEGNVFGEQPGSVPGLTSSVPNCPSCPTCPDCPVLPVPTDCPLVCPKCP